MVAAHRRLRSVSPGRAVAPAGGVSPSIPPVCPIVATVGRRRGDPSGHRSGTTPPRGVVSSGSPGGPTDRRAERSVPGGRTYRDRAVDEGARWRAPSSTARSRYVRPPGTLLSARRSVGPPGDPDDTTPRGGVVPDRCPEGSPLLRPTVATLGHTGGMDGETPPAGATARPGETERSRRWAATMACHEEEGVTFAHLDSRAATGAGLPTPGFDRAAREELERELLAPGATHAAGSGDRVRAEEPDPWRTCFERDRDRILHAPSFRRLAGKTQVFVFPDDHQRTRLTHALEVAQVATGIARACRLNVALTEAIALGHDCGHGPGGHASEDALSPYVD